MDKDKLQLLLAETADALPLPDTGADFAAAERAFKEACGDAVPCPDDLNAAALAHLRGIFYPALAENEAPAHAEGIDLYLFFLATLLKRESKALPFDPLRCFALLSKDAAASSDVAEEYEHLRALLYEEHLYTFMRLSDALTPYRTLAHVAGVHHVARHMARQMKQAGLTVDEALISGAALIHDIGKYGCSRDESGRVAYLHYYYTYDFASRFGLPGIGLIASSHSVWDLELDNLSAESLLLIYADFRVKAARKDGKEEMRFLTLAEAYAVILGKLDNVDEAKRQRYARVYTKLADFEEYLISLGCDPDLAGHYERPASETPLALVDAAGIARKFRQLAVASNLQVMVTANHDASFISMLERIRAERDWRHVRACLTVIGEYSTYMKQSQKDVILQFLYELLSHRDGDIRRQAARTAAEVIANYEITFTKELPETAISPELGGKMGGVWRAFLHQMLFPGHMMTEQHRRWIGYAMKTVLRELLQITAGNARLEILQIYLEYYKSARWDTLTCFFLLDGACEVPYADCNPTQVKLLVRFVRRFLTDSQEELKVAALRFLDLWLTEGFLPDEELSTLPAQTPDEADAAPCIRYLRRRIRLHLHAEAAPFICDPQTLYLENQRAEIPWIFKLVNLQILREMHDGAEAGALYQYASHLLNLLQFTPRITNKLRAGWDLTAVMPRLAPAQQYEIVLELIRALDLGEYAVSKYIPQYLGRIYTLLPVRERGHVLDHLRALVESRNAKVVVTALETVGVILSRLPSIPRESDDEKAFADTELARAEGLLGMGIVHYDPDIAREAVFIFGEGVIGAPTLSLNEKRTCFSPAARKMLTFTRWGSEDLDLYYHAAALSHIGRFLTEYELTYGEIPVKAMHRVAFFPGTFDPFSLGHKAIVREIAAMGFQVFLAVDEFSWSKKTQPYMVRRKILAMSVADMENVYLFPMEIPVNIANPADLTRLRACFPEDEVYLVAGSDVIANASAYLAAPTEGSAHGFPHILFSRNTEDAAADMDLIRSRISGEILHLKLPAYFENMSSTRIRSNVSANKDITNLVEPMVQNYIYDRSLYTMEPMYKQAARIRAIDTEITDGPDAALLAEAGLSPDGNPAARLLILRDRLADDAIRGAVLFHSIGVSDLCAECGSIEETAHLRSLISGRIAVITAISGDRSDTGDFRLSALNEMLAVCQEAGMSYCLCFAGDMYADLLLLHGFCEVPGSAGTWLVDMRAPLVLYANAGAQIKDPFAEKPEVRQTLWKCHLRLRREAVRLYPGNLVLSFESEILNHRLSGLIRKHNPLPEVMVTKKKLGRAICVPFGKILKGVLIPECVTKDLYTEKLYDVNLQQFEIREFPQYTPLDIQIRTIASFMRPLLLVDDFYHKGYRLEAVRDKLSAEGLDIDCFIVGVKSGRGADLARTRQIPIDSVYFVPNMRAWLIESDLYPFIGGDGVRTAAPEKLPSLPSVNCTLPYQVPSYLNGASMEAFYRLSRVCLENAREIYLALEKEYQVTYGRKLTLDRLSEIMAEPRHPDGAVSGEAALADSPSVLIGREMQKLRRLRHLLDGNFTFP